MEEEMNDIQRMIESQCKILKREIPECIEIKQGTMLMKETIYCEKKQCNIREQCGFYRKRIEVIERIMFPTRQHMGVKEQKVTGRIMIPQEGFLPNGPMKMW